MKPVQTIQMDFWRSYAAPYPGGTGLVKHITIRFPDPHARIARWAVDIAKAEEHQRAIFKKAIQSKGIVRAWRFESAQSYKHQNQRLTAKAHARTVRLLEKTSPEILPTWLIASSPSDEFIPLETLGDRRMLLDDLAVAKDISFCVPSSF